MNSLKQNQPIQAENNLNHRTHTRPQSRNVNTNTQNFICTKLVTSSINSSMSDVCARMMQKPKRRRYFCVSEQHTHQEQSRLNSMKFLRSVSQQWLGWELTSHCKSRTKNRYQSFENEFSAPLQNLAPLFSRWHFSVWDVCTHTGAADSTLCGTGPLKFHHFDARKRTIQHQTYTWCVGAGGVPLFF